MVPFVSGEMKCRSRKHFQIKKAVSANMPLPQTKSSSRIRLPQRRRKSESTFTAARKNRPSEDSEPMGDALGSETGAGTSLVSLCASRQHAAMEDRCGTASATNRRPRLPCTPCTPCTPPTREACRRQPVSWGRASTSQVGPQRTGLFIALFNDGILLRPAVVRFAMGNRLE